MARKGTRVGRGIAEGTTTAPSLTPGPWRVKELQGHAPPGGGYVVLGKDDIVIGAFGRNTSTTGYRISQEEALGNAYSCLFGLNWEYSKLASAKRESANVRAGKKRTRR